jgi:two-component system sensor histidine kinase CpxA
METAIQPNLTMVGNEELIRRALENLVRNAIKYTHQGSQIEITLAKSPEGINFTLEDNGPGIPESDLQRIFEPFVRLDSARSSDSGGYGLGLAIAKKAIEVHGGTLLAKARSQGAGLCFSAHIPTELT